MGRVSKSKVVTVDANATNETFRFKDVKATTDLGRFSMRRASIK